MVKSIPKTIRRHIMKHTTICKWLSAILIVAVLGTLLGLQAFAAGSAAVEQVSFAAAEDGAKFDLYSNSAGGFALQDGLLTPTGDAGEFKAMYKDNGQPIRAVSVEMHPVGNDGMYGGLYINAANAGNGQDAIDALYVGIESHFAGWDDAINRVDITLGKFTQGWAGEVGERFISETGRGNNLFSGSKQPIQILAEMDANVLTVTVSL